MTKKTNRPKATSRKRSATSRIIITGIIIAAIGFVAVVMLVSADREAPTGQSMTLEPAIIANLTALPVATPMSNQDLDAWDEMVQGCEDYSPERRSQMEQHIEWIQDPASIPPNVVVALGQNTSGRLVYGMASYTSIQWRLNDRPEDSCLISIGRRLNEFLVTLDEERIDVYDGVSP